MMDSLGEDLLQHLIEVHLSEEDLLQLRTSAT